MQKKLDEIKAQALAQIENSDVLEKLNEVKVNFLGKKGELPARSEEVEHAIEEGVDFKLLNNPVKIIGENGYVKKVRCIKMELGAEDEKGRRRPIPIEGSVYDLYVDVIIMAIGTSPNPLLKN